MISFLILMKLSLPLNQSILLQIYNGYLLTKVMYYVQDYIELKMPIRKKKNTNKQKIISILGENNLSEEYITDFCVKKGIPKVAESIYLFLNNTLEDTADLLGVEPSTITRRIITFIKESQK